MRVNPSDVGAGSAGGETFGLPHEKKAQHPEATSSSANVLRRHTNRNVLQIRGVNDKKGKDNSMYAKIARTVLVKEKPDHFHEPGWQWSLCRIVGDPYVHHILNLLLIIDMIILVVSMQMEVYYLESQVEAFSEACHDDAHSLHDYGNHKIETIEHNLEYASIAILSIFAFEIVLAIIGEGKVFFNNPLHCLDMVVVAVSLYFEIDGHNVAAGVLVLVRTWRFLRIVHGVVEILEEDEVTDESIIKDTLKHWKSSLSKKIHTSKKTFTTIVHEHLDEIEKEYKEQHGEETTP